MDTPVFKKSDFTLCDVPVPKGYPQSQTHAGIAVHNGLFYLTCSPYPLKKVGLWKAYIHILLQKLTNGKLGNFIDADSFENPLLYEGDDKNVVSPSKFRLLLPAPLMEKPMPQLGVQAYNSDPDIFIEDGNIYILNRQYSRKKTNTGCIEQKTKIFLTEGSVSDKISLRNPALLIESFDSLLSPCLSKLNDKYLFAYVNSNSALDGHTFDGIYLSKANTVDELRELPNLKRIKLNEGNLLPWHMSLFVYNNKLYAIVACVEKGIKGKIWQMLGVFNETQDCLTIYQTPLTDYNSYRGSACVLDDGTFVLYSTTLREKVKGSKSVDGRDIITAKCNFIELLFNLDKQNGKS